MAEKRDLLLRKRRKEKARYRELERQKQATKAQERKKVRKKETRVHVAESPTRLKLAAANSSHLANNIEKQMRKQSMFTYRK